MTNSPTRSTGPPDRLADPSGRPVIDSPESVPTRQSTLHRGGGVALWRQIEQALEADIRAGVLVPGDRLPTEAALARHFAVNRHTLRRALAGLVERGLIRVEQGRGSFVQEDVLDYAVGRRTRVSEIVSSPRRAPGGRLLSARVEPADAAVARAMGLRKGTRCVVLERIGEADGRPICVAAHHFPAARFPDMIDVYRQAGSITRALQQHGVGDYTRRLTRVTARMPDSDDATHLQQPRNRPILVVESVNVDRAGQPIEYGYARFASDRVQIVFET